MVKYPPLIRSRITQGEVMALSVAWREGMFIRPQHFQQNNFAYSSEMMDRTLAAGPNQWGLFSFEIDHKLLEQGKIALTKATGVMPDGTIFDSKDLVESLVLEVESEDAGKTIYLALPHMFANEDNVFFEEHKPIPTRYRAQTHEDVPNTNAGEDSKADIPMMHLNFRLVKSGDSIDGYTTIPIAIIKSLTPNKAISLDESFYPTFLHLHEAKALVSRLLELQSVVRTRADNLAEKIEGGTLQSSELADYLLLQILNQNEAKLHYFATQERIHPGDLFLELASMYGELSVFLKAGKRPSNPHTYIHHEQYKQMSGLFSDLVRLLGTVLESKSIQLPLEKHRFGVYAAIMHDKSVMANSLLVLAVSSNIEQGKLKKLLLDNLKIGTIDEISHLVNHHLPGFKITPLATAPREIPYRVNQSYYQIDMSPEDLKKLMASSGIALHYPETAKLNIDFILWAIKK